MGKLIFAIFVVVISSAVIIAVWVMGVRGSTGRDPLFPPPMGLGLGVLATVWIGLTAGRLLHSLMGWF